MALHNKIGIGLLAGVVVGLLAGQIGWLHRIVMLIEPIGPAWIKLIMMIVIPLVVASLLVGTASLGDIRKLGRIGGKTLAYYMTTTAFAVMLGLLVSNVVEPGGRVDPSTRDRIGRAHV